VKVSSASVPLPQASVMSRAIASSCAPVLAAAMAALMSFMVALIHRAGDGTKASHPRKQRFRVDSNVLFWEDQSVMS